MLKRPFNNPWSWVPSLYFAEGLPYAIVTVVSVMMYKRLGLSNAEVTFYTSMFYLPWVIKPLWSPFIDILKTERWWIVSMQLLIGAAIAGVAFTIPTSFWIQCTVCFFWMMAFFSATHDIAADGYYMHALDGHQQSFFVGIRSLFYRLSMMFGQGILIIIAGSLEWWTRNVSYAWALMFYLVAGIMVAIGLYHFHVLPKNKKSYEVTDIVKRKVGDVLNDFKDTFKSFFSKKDVLVALFFMLFYRLPEGLLVKICPLFLVDPISQGGLGLSPQEIGLVQGTVGVIGLVLGGILGGIYVSQCGLRKALWPMVCSITLPDVVYVLLAYLQTDSLLVINICVFLEQFGYGLGFTAYMMYLIYFSQGERKTAHYSICTGFMALSLFLPGLVAGLLQEVVGYRYFFVIVMLLCTLTFVAAAMIKLDPKFGKKSS